MIVNNCASLSFLLVTKAKQPRKQQSMFGNGKNRSAWSVHRLKYTNFNVTVCEICGSYNVYIYRKHHDTLATVMKNDRVSQI